MKLPFDKIYCLHLAEQKERYESSKLEFAKVGILDKVEYWWTVKRPFANKCGLCYESITNDDYYSCMINETDIAGKVFNCAIEHHNIIKQAYYRGFNSILIFEDDIKFNVNKEELNRVWDNIPKDFDIIAFQNTIKQLYKRDKYEEKNNENLDKFYKISGTNQEYAIYGTMMYALSNRVMKEIISIVENNNIMIADRFYDYIDRSKFNVYEPACELIELDMGNSLING